MPPVQILRDQTHRVSPDMSKAIERQNLAGTFSDIAQVANVAQSVIGTVQKARGAIAANAAKEFEEKHGTELELEKRKRMGQYQKDFGTEMPDADFQAMMSDLTKKYGANISNSMARESFDEAMGRSTGVGRLALQESSIKRAASEDMERVQNENLAPLQHEISRWMIQQKEAGADIGSRSFEKQYRAKVAELGKKFAPGKETWGSARAAYEKSVKSFTENGVAANIRAGNQQRASKSIKSIEGTQAQGIDIATKLGFTGSGVDLGSAISDTFKGIESYAKKGGVIGGVEDLKVSTGRDMVQKFYAAQLQTPNWQATDAALLNNENFEKSVPEEYLSAVTNRAEDLEKYRLGNELLLAQSELSMTRANKELTGKTQEKIDKIQAQLDDISSPDSKFREKTITAEREKMQKEIKPLATKMYGDKLLATRQEEFNKMQLGMSKAITDVNPTLGGAVLRAAKNTLMDVIMPGSPLVSKAYSYVRGENGDFNIDGEKIDKITKNLQKYQDDSVVVSFIENSSPELKSIVGDKVTELLALPATDKEGNPIDFQLATTDFLAWAGKQQLTEDERTELRKFVGGLSIARNEDLKELRSVLGSDDYAVYSRESMRSSTGREQQAHSILRGLKGGVRFREEDLDRFDDRIGNAYGNYFVQAISAINNGQVTGSDLIKMRKQIIGDAVDDYYSSRYVVNLKELREKKENKQPAIQKLDGVVYEYTGDDSNGMPIWRDHTVLNTNNDFTRLTKSNKMGIYGESPAELEARISGRGKK